MKIIWSRKLILIFIVLLLTLQLAIFLPLVVHSDAPPGQVWAGIQATGKHRQVPVHSLPISQTVTASFNEQIISSTEPFSYHLYLPLIVGRSNPGECLSPAENELVNLINEYRNSNGLAPVPVSKSLMQVAQWHVIDLHENNPDTGSDHGLACNLHSWSDKGNWSPVCYTSDHAYASGMWNKPREITSNIYTGNGYENAFGSSGQATATGAFNSWTNEASHRDVILEQGIWSGYNWPAIGVGVYEHHAVLWFGDKNDPQGTVTQTCDIYN